MAGTPDDTPEGQWLTVREAARALGVSVQSVRRRIKRGTLESRRDNRRGTLVLLDATEGAATGGTPVAPETAVLLERVAGLESTVAELRGRVAAAEADRDRWHAEATRRRWPGLRRLARWLWRGDDDDGGGG